jgi:tetratricopeptide (TPR) repeat protein
VTLVAGWGRAWPRPTRAANNKEDVMKPGMMVVWLCGLVLASLCFAQPADEAAAFYDKGVELLGAGEPFEALEAFTKAIARKPDFVEAFSGQGDAYSQTSRYPLAILSYTEAIKLRPGYADALSGRGFAHYFSEQYGQAREDFVAAINADVVKADSIVGFLVRELVALGSSLKERK